MKRALFSVSDKAGVVEFASQLESLGWEIIATGGTMKLLQDAGLKIINISEVTGFPEICDGRVKTLHPKVHGALLGRRDLESHRQQLKENGIEYIDMVCVNLYPFRQTISKPDVTMDDAIENIDIGGPSMLRSAAKNWKSVTVVCDPSDYAMVIDEIRAGGDTTPETRLKLSAKAYTHTAEYDMMISTYMRKQAGLNEKLFLEYDLKQGLRYGENPHQEAKFYASVEKVPFSLATAEQLNGKELSYNNIQWKKTFEADKVSIFGGIVATNQEVNREVAELMKPVFLEIIMAPSFTQEALDVLCTKKNLRLLKVDMTKDNAVHRQYVSMNGGLLVQDQDLTTKTVVPEMCVTETKPEDSVMEDLNFAWHIVKHVKSNAIVVVKDGMTLGVGAGQMNRIGSAEIALKEAEAAYKAKGEDVRKAGLVMASDGFFPFDDCVTLAAEYGVKAIVQPGGSIRDNDSIAKANENHIAMLFTGMRHFKH